MKKILLSLLTLSLMAVVWFASAPSIETMQVSSREEFEKFLAQHPYTQLLKKGKNKPDGGIGYDRPDLAMLQNFMMTMDPALKRPTPEVLYSLNRYSAAVRDRKLLAPSTSISTATQWSERGPREVAGRTRALMFDPTDSNHKKVWAGGVSGGMWYNNDVTDANSTWQKVNDFWDNLSVSAIAADPNNAQTWYVGTGEFGYDFRGAGVWKTTDAGATWTQLASTTSFQVIKDVAVRNEAGLSVVYLAVQPTFEQNYNAGLYRSTNGGTSWQQVLPGATVNTAEPNLPSDIEIGADNALYVTASKHWFMNDAVSTIYKSNTGSPGSWQSVNTFGTDQTNGRLEIACAPSNANVLYLLTEENGGVEGVYKSINGGASWSQITKPVDVDPGIPADDFSRGQAWYDLILAVDPSNENIAYAGAIDWFRTDDGGNSWSQISKWWWGFATNGPTVHADQHGFMFRPGSTNEAIIGNDGGVYYASSLSNAVSDPSAISARNVNYNVTQFYTAAIHPTNADYMLGGTQDNGTQQFTQAGFGDTNEAFGGDGALCFIDQLSPNVQIVSYVYNNIYLSTNGGASVSVALLEDGSSGNFINNGAYDSYQKILFTAKDEQSVYRISGVGNTNTVETLPIDLGQTASCMRISPHTTASSTLFVGTFAGRLFKVTNANGTSPNAQEIGSVSFPTGTISCVAVGATEDQLLVTFSNFGVVSVWETRNGGNTWINREGNLPNMPIRWAEYHPLNFDQVYLATELGVWSTDNINENNAIWNATNGGLANVRTDMLQVRTDDGTIMAATHGRGVFTALLPAELEQEITFAELVPKTFGAAAFTVSAASTSDLPVTFSSSNTSVATVSGNTVTIVGAGETFIVASQAGNGFFAPAPPVQRLLTVNRASQTITWAALPEVDANDAPFTLTASTSASLPVTFNSANSSVASISGNTVTIHAAGTTTLTASQAGNANFLPATNIARELVVLSRIISITGSLSFGDVFIGESAEKTITIQSLGTGSIAVEDIVYPTGFTGTETVAGSQLQVKVVFTPTENKDYAGVVQVQSNATGGTNTIPALGRGILITNAEELIGSGVEVYPNPAEDFIVIKSKHLDASSTNFVFRDAAGKQWIQPATTIDASTVRVSIKELTAGTYFINVPYANEVRTIRILKK